MDKAVGEVTRAVMEAILLETATTMVVDTDNTRMEIAIPHTVTTGTAYHHLHLRDEGQHGKIIDQIPVYPQDHLLSIMIISPTMVEDQTIGMDIAHVHGILTEHELHRHAAEQEHRI